MNQLEFCLNLASSRVVLDIAKFLPNHTAPNQTIGILKYKIYHAFQSFSCATYDKSIDFSKANSPLPAI
jgi:hypothetical protein